MSILGIDIGTTSVKLTLYDEEKQEAVTSATQPANAYIESEFSEQDVNLIWLSLEELLVAVGTEKLRGVKRVSVSCQMHGVVLWRKQDSPDAPLETSYLITWEDQRCDDAFLRSLPLSKYQKICTGFGCASLFWLARHKREFVDMWDFAGTVGDLLVSRLCGVESCFMSPQNAAFWGYFDVEKNTWETDELLRSGFPVRLLPPVVPVGHVVGHVTEAWGPLPSGTSVTVALGDLQASTLAATWDHRDAAVVNVGTSAQLVLPLTYKLRPLSRSIVVAPYFDGASIAVAASLNGGNVLSHFVAMLRSWLIDLGVTEDRVTEERLWGRLGALALAAKDEDVAKTPVVHPRLFGERLSKDGCAEVLRIVPGEGLKLGAVFKAVCSGLMQNLRDMAAEVLEAPPPRIFGCGSALTRNAALRKAFLKTFEDCGAEILSTEVDASLGAALSVCSRQ